MTVNNEAPAQIVKLNLLFPGQAYIPPRNGELTKKYIESVKGKPGTDGDRVRATLRRQLYNTPYTP